MTTRATITLLLCSMLCAAAAKKRNKGGSLPHAGDLTLYTPVQLKATRHTNDFAVFVPTKPSRQRAIANPSDLFEHVSHAWDGVVGDHNNGGLVDAKQEGKAQPPLG